MVGLPLPMNLVAAGILPAVEPWLPARRKWLGKIPDSQSIAAVVPSGKMPALYGRQVARRHVKAAQIVSIEREIHSGVSFERRIGGFGGDEEKPFGGDLP